MSLAISATSASMYAGSSIGAGSSSTSSSALDFHNTATHNNNYISLAEYKEAFAYFDKDRDNKITREEFGHVLRAVGHAPTEAELAAMQKAIDRAYGGCEFFVCSKLIIQ